MEKASTGAVRSVLYKTGEHGHPIRLDLLLTNDEALRRLGETFGEGNEKYGPDNWKKGFKESVLINHAFEHMILHMNGDTSEDHLAHACWNLMTLMWVQKNHPELIDISKLATLQKLLIGPTQAQSALMMATRLNEQQHNVSLTSAELSLISLAFSHTSTLREQQYTDIVRCFRRVFGDDVIIP